MKKIMSVTIEEDLISWLTVYSQSQSKFRNKSHLVEVALERLKNDEEKSASTTNSQATQNRRKRSTTHKRNLL
jgi:Arc/MetJ-type ribon-helix-helix transcriptional regulator